MKADDVKIVSEDVKQILADTIADYENALAKHCNQHILNAQLFSLMPIVNC